MLISQGFRPSRYTKVRAVLLAGLFIICLFCCREVNAGSSTEAALPLQPIIDSASEGDLITLAPGTYSGPVRLNKRVTINGNGKAILLHTAKDEQAAVLIAADGVRLENLKIQQNNDGEAAAVRVEADRVTLKGLVIHSAGYGILLREADGGVISDNKISWFIPKGEAPGTRGNGIDLYNSHGAVIRGNDIVYLRDGIYLENSRNTVVDQNKLAYLRYGVHCMYINGSKVTNNTGEYNITGAMVMGVTDVVVSGNSFRKQSRNVHSQGILLYDVQNSEIMNNRVEGNRVGIYMQQSSDNKLQQNLVLRNYIGVQFENAEGNRFERNGFIANVIEAQATGSRNNDMNGNYWDAFGGLDLTGDGVSDLKYAINPFYQQLVAGNAAYQLFFQSPGMTFLSDMYTGGSAGWSTDSAPLMQLETGTVSPDQAAGGQGTVMVVGWLLLFLSVITIIYLGVLRL
ncbi:right-handed parallel beta-helix repeat-containing protein [Paenibacillus sp. FSL R7-0179]|uniref:right-handed parallel beta-helix repeat-containing protein n=1 Tax=Paenibacillus sp. FSL R7-0179 TaxID=2921672 RepID=UPI0030F82BB8